jgi:RNA polymerase sigma-70 factor, ECF subfamily
MAQTLQALQPMPEALSTVTPTELDGVGELYRQHADFVHHTILRLGGPAIDADDLTHEVFLVALRKWGGLPPGTDARAWLHGVAALAVSTARRKALWRRRLGLANLAFGSRDSSSDTRSFASDLEQRQARAEVYRLVETMSEKKRMVFLLFELEGLSGEEIATLVRAPLKTVWTRLHHARRHFLKALELERKREP